MSSLKELLCVEGHYFSITVTLCLSVKESLAVCYEVNVLSAIQLLLFCSLLQLRLTAVFVFFLWWTPINWFPSALLYLFLWVWVELVFMAGCLSCHPTISVKALKGTRSTEPNQWADIVLFTTRLLMEWALLPLLQLSDASTVLLLYNL